LGALIARYAGGACNALGASSAGCARDAGIALDAGWPCRSYTAGRTRKALRALRTRRRSGNHYRRGRQRCDLRWRRVAGRDRERARARSSRSRRSRRCRASAVELQVSSHLSRSSSRINT
jgi:hypothetical protein